MMKDKVLDIEKLEPAAFRFSKGAFSPRDTSCRKCGGKMERGELEVEFESGVYAKLQGFKCRKCDEKVLGLDEARKLDRLMVLNKLYTEDFRLERSLSFDGDNYLMRIPKEFTRLVHDRKIDIIPLGKREFYGRIR